MSVSGKAHAWRADRCPRMVFGVWSVGCQERGSLPAGALGCLPAGGADLDTLVEMPIAMRYRAMRAMLMRRVEVRRSFIHRRGLFALTAFAMNELVIEYVGELIRPT